MASAVLLTRPGPFSFPGKALRSRAMLKRDRLPPDFQPAVMEREIRADGEDGKLLDNKRFFRLFNCEAGVYGDRAGNAWRCRRRQWIERFVWVKTKGGKLTRLILNDVQRRLEAEVIRMERAGVPVRIIILKARQMGCSTYIAALEFWYAATHAHGRSCIIAQKTDVSRDIAERVALMVTEIRKDDGKPWALKLSAKAAGRIVLGEPLYGQIVIESAEVDEPARGKTFQVLHMSESPIWPEADRKADAVAQTLADEVGTYGFNEATANGDFGWFPREFKRAWADNRMGRKVRFGWRGFFAPWYWDQTYRWSHMTGAQPDAEHTAEIMGTLTAEEKLLLGRRYVVRKKGWREVDIDQLAWRRHTIKNKCRGSLEAFHQEYPSTPEEAFLSSGMPLFEPALIQKQRDLGVREPLFRGALVDPEAEELLSRRPMSLEEREALQRERDALGAAG